MDPLKLGQTDPRPFPRAVTPVTFPNTHVAVAFNYQNYVNFTPYQISTIVFPNGLPFGWSWEAWALAAGRPNPMTHDVRDKKIEPMPPFMDPDALVGSGEMDLMPGETKLVTTTTEALISWVAHAPQYNGPCEMHVADTLVPGAYMSTSVTPGTYALHYDLGPAQGVRVALRPR
jgi:hypothetical protein